jgi:hypothetical protein
VKSGVAIAVETAARAAEHDVMARLPSRIAACGHFGHALGPIRGINDAVDGRLPVHEAVTDPA